MFFLILRASKHIIGRISQIAESREWDTGNSKGQARTFHLLDSTGEVACTLFNESVEKFCGLLVVRASCNYMFSGFYIGNYSYFS